MQMPAKEASTSIEYSDQDDADSNNGYLAYDDEGDDSSEDVAMMCVFAYMDYLDEDLNWSMLSNACFFTGGTAYVLLTVWDLLWQVSEHRKYLFPLFVFLDVIAPTVYLFNSFVDIAWAKSAQGRLKVKRTLKGIIQEKIIHKPIAELSPETNLIDSIDTLAAETESKKPRRIGLRRRIGRRLKRLRKHAAHRRNYYAAVAFGIAAVFAVVEVVLRYIFGQSCRAAFIADICANQTYILSALFALTGKRTRPFQFNFDLSDVDNMEDLGDLLFLIGAGMDSILTDIRYDADFPIWPVISSFLWLFDACLYIQSDRIRIQMSKDAPDNANIV